MSLDEAGAMGEATFSRIVDILRDQGVRHVLEFGSGQSSLRLERVIDARITSVEHDVQWIEKVRGGIASTRLEVVARQLQPRSFGDQVLWSYAPVTLAEPVQAVIIDGPPYWTLRGREACLYEIYDRLPVGSFVFLDDCFREGERNALQNWAAVYPSSLDVRIERASHGLAILHKVAHVEPRWDAEVRRADGRVIDCCYRDLHAALTAVGSFQASKWPLTQMCEAYGIVAGTVDLVALRGALGRLAEILGPRLDPGLT